MDFRMLGLLEVVDGDRRIELRGTKVRSLLAVLLLRANQVVATDRLAEALWGDDRPGSAANTLQGYVSQLRKALGADLIQTRSHGYVLAVPPHQIDALRFERLKGEGRDLLAEGDPQAATDRLTEALGLWRGEALADFTFEPFAQAPITHLNELRLAAIEDRFEAHLALGVHAELVGPLRSHVDAHPLRERPWGQLVTALYRCGRQAEALRAFGELRRHLDEELGIEPGAPLKALEYAVLMQSPDLEWHAPVAASTASVSDADVPHNLPVARTSFIGREREAAAIEKLVAGGGLVTVVGPGGSGKSRLAREVARNIRHDYRGGVWLLDVGPVEAAGLLSPAVASVLGTDEAGITKALDGRPTLLVLDNCEHLVDATAGLAGSLLAEIVDLTVLATSRQPLRVEGEMVWRLPPLPVPPPGDPPPGTDVTTDFDAVALFVERASATGGFTLTPETTPTVAELCRRLDGMPLAIELAAARSRALTPAQLLERLGDRFALLTGGPRTPARHRSLAASLDWSHHLLTEREQVLFRRLGVFDGEFTLEDAEAMGAEDEGERTNVIDVLAALVERSLVLADHSSSDVRYCLPHSHRAYALLRLAEAQTPAPLTRAQR